MLHSYGTPLLMKPRSSLLSGLVAYWRLEANSNDSVGSINGTDTNVSYSACKVGNGLVSSGGGKSALGTAGALALTGAMTISCWFNWADFSNYRFMVTRMVGAGGTFNNFELRTNPSSRIEWGGPGGGVVSSTTGALSTSTWYHVIVTRAGGSGTLGSIFINNGAAGTGNIPTADDAAAKAYLGTRDDLFQTLPSGSKLDEIGIWNREITSTERAVLYNSGNGKAFPFS